MNRYKCVVTDVNATAAAAAHPDGAYVKWTDHVAEVERLRELLLDARQSVNAELCVIEPLYAPRAVELRKRIARIDAALAPAAQGTVKHAKNCAFVIDSGYRIPSPCTCGATDTQGAAT